MQSLLPYLAENKAMRIEGRLQTDYLPDDDRRPGSDSMTRERKRLRRQFEMLERTFPSLKGPISAIQKNHWRMVRMPLGIVMVLGSFLAILPVLGLWMLPFGLLLLAIDLPFLQPTVNAVLIRGRRRIELWRRWWRRKRN